MLVDSESERGLEVRSRIDDMTAIPFELGFFRPMEVSGRPFEARDKSG
jgi:hypothetical protein